MLENKVAVSILSLLRRPDGEEERIEEEVPGLLYREGEVWTLAYREGSSGGLGETRAALRLEGEGVELTRTGAVRCRMIFRTGEPHASLYETPYGAFPVAVRPRRVRWEMDKRGGTVELDYQMELGGAPDGTIRLRLTVRERERAYK